MDAYVGLSPLNAKRVWYGLYKSRRIISYVNYTHYSVTDAGSRTHFGRALLCTTQDCW